MAVTAVTAAAKETLYFRATFAAGDLTHRGCIRSPRAQHSYPRPSLPNASVRRHTSHRLPPQKLSSFPRFGFTGFSGRVERDQGVTCLESGAPRGSVPPGAIGQPVTRRFGGGRLGRRAGPGHLCPAAARWIHPRCQGTGHPMNSPLQCCPPENQPSACRAQHRCRPQSLSLITGGTRAWLWHLSACPPPRDGPHTLSRVHRGLPAGPAWKSKPSPRNRSLPRARMIVSRTGPQKGPPATSSGGIRVLRQKLLSLSSRTLPPERVRAGGGGGELCCAVPGETGR